LHGGKHARKCPVAHPESREVIDRAHQVIEVGAAHAMAARDTKRDFLDRKQSRIPIVRRVCDERERAHFPSRQARPYQPRPVDVAAHLAHPERVERRCHIAPRHAVRDAPARAATFQPQH
jgi:hypothetical protein